MNNFNKYIEFENELSEKRREMIVNMIKHVEGAAKHLEKSALFLDELLKDNEDNNMKYCADKILEYVDKLLE